MIKIKQIFKLYETIQEIVDGLIVYELMSDKKIERAKEMIKAGVAGRENPADKLKEIIKNRGD